jgi:hypothetical protein
MRSEKLNKGLQYQTRYYIFAASQTYLESSTPFPLGHVNVFALSYPLQTLPILRGICTERPVSNEAETSPN